MANRLFSGILKAASQGAFPKTRKRIWKFVYTLMAWFWRDPNWRFMNYGYMPEMDEPFALDERDEADRAFIGLYHQAVEGLDLAGKSVLEVGCGRGGGSSYIARYYNCAKVVGGDFSSSTVSVAKKLNKDISTLSFEIADAENLPFADNSFDVVINIESSHCYSNVPSFIDDVARVLKPEGIFSWADLRGRTMTDKLEADIQHASLSLVHKKELTPGVIRALRFMSDKKQEQIKKTPFFRRFMSEFAATEGTTLFNGFQNGNVVYEARRYKKIKPSTV